MRTNPRPRSDHWRNGAVQSSTGDWIWMAPGGETLAIHPMLSLNSLTKWWAKKKSNTKNEKNCQNCSFPLYQGFRGTRNASAFNLVDGLEDPEHWNRHSRISGQLDSCIFISLHPSATFYSPLSSQARPQPNGPMTLVALRVLASARSCISHAA